MQHVAAPVAVGPKTFRMGDVLEHVAIVPGLLFMLALFGLPFVYTVWKSVSDPALGIDNYTAIAEDPLYLRLMANTVISAIGTTLACVAIGYPLTYAIYRARSTWKRIMMALVLISYAVGTVPRAFAWLVLLGDHGLLNQLLFAVRRSDRPIEFLYTQLGVLIGMTQVMLPFFVLILLGSMIRIDNRLVPAARTLGASGVQAFVTVFLPLSSPGLLAASMLTFIYSLGFYVIPAVLGGPAQATVVMKIQSLVLQLGEWGLGAGLATLLAVAAVGGALVYVRTTGLTAVATHD